MSTSSTESTATRMTDLGYLGDACPSWCGGEHREMRRLDDGRPMHPEDSGAYHHSKPVDSWRPMVGDQLDDQEIDVRVEGFRHDNGDEWADEIHATNVCPGFLADVGLQIADARRLGEALLMACDLAEGKQARA